MVEFFLEFFRARLMPDQRERDGVRWEKWRQEGWDYFSSINFFYFGEIAKTARGNI
jgi:hypothetical protein